MLDLGCGDGAFLASERGEEALLGGRDIDPANLVTAVSRGLDVIQEDINDGLHCFTTNRFDVVILAHALQELTHPHIALQRMVNIADEAIVSFPNFGHWSCRLHLGVKVVCPCLGSCRATGTTPPTFTFCTVTDFDALCSALHIDIIERATIAGPAHTFWAAGPNLFATSAIYRIRRSGG